LNIRREVVIALALLVLCGCAGGGADNHINMSRSEILAQVQLGRSVLHCEEACLPAWRDAQPRAALLDASSQWGDLAVLVTRAKYRDDLSLYYLGRAAEGMGFYSAAVSYYRQSTGLSRTSASCAYLSRLCGGAMLPTDAAQRLRIAQQRLTKPASRHRQTVIRAHTAPATTDPVPQAAALYPGETPSTQSTGDRDEKTTTAPAVSSPALVNPSSDSLFVEPPPSIGGYLGPAAKTH
jgi:hypothetical protein